MRAQVYMDGKWMATFDSLDRAEEILGVFLGSMDVRAEIVIGCDGRRREWSARDGMFVDGRATFTTLAEKAMATRVRSCAINYDTTLEDLAAKSDKELMGMVNLGKKGIAWIRANVKRTDA